ncbi:MAG: hypothetical protein HOC36_01540 [Candidatus Magasanikbacteria bacterium]|nr:hypothetical protein [Candidatus Magasanikbacteria bacterium]
MSTRKDSLARLVRGHAVNYIDPVGMVLKEEGGEGVLEVRLDSKYGAWLGLGGDGLGCVPIRSTVSAEEFFSSVALVCQIAFPEFSLAQVPVVSRGGLTFWDGGGVPLRFHRKNKQLTVLEAVNFFFSLNLFLLSRFAFCEAIRRGQSGFPREVGKTTLGDVGDVVHCLGNSTIPSMLARVDSSVLLSYCRIFG